MSHQQTDEDPTMLSNHAELLTKWAELPHHKNNCFIRDGIIDESNWSTANRKVLFLLREAYDRAKRPEGFDLCQAIRNWDGKKRKPTWAKLSSWSYAALNGTRTNIPVSNDKSARRNALCSTAVVNVKKSGGVKTSDKNEIAQFAQQDGALLREQIDMIDPKIVICGGTWKAVSHLFENKIEEIGDRAHRVGFRTFIQFWHPANRSPKALNYYALGYLLQNSGCLDD